MEFNKVMSIIKEYLEKYKLTGSRKKTIFLGIVFLGLMTTLTFFFMYKNNSGIIISRGSNKIQIDENKTSELETTKTKELQVDNTKESTRINQIKVYVTGCVNNPGIVTLNAGQIVNDAIMQSGGFTKEADAENINLVYVLKENVMLKIRSKLECHGISNNGNTNKSCNMSGLQMIKTINTDYLRSKDTENCVETEIDADKSTNSSEKININYATQEQLERIPGVGKVTANRIILYRQENGNFETKEDLKKVPGIGETKFKNIEELIET